MHAVTSIYQIQSCIQSLVTFGRNFYNSQIDHHLGCLLEFFETYAQYHDPDAETCVELISR